VSRGVPTAAARAPARRLRLARREAIWGYVFISPWIVGFLVFSAGPILVALGLGFTDYNILEAPRFVGLSNYVRALTVDPLFWTSVYNTVYYVVLGVPLQMLLAFTFALLLNSRLRGILIYRTMFYVPVVVPHVAAAVLWTWLFDPELGPMRVAFDLVGLPMPHWIFAEEWAKPAMIVILLWHLGAAMIIYLAGLQGIPEHLYEAAAIDGAGWWSRLVNVTVPLMTPTIFYNLIIGIINSFQVFTYAYVMTKGGPLNSTLFYVLYVYRNGFEFLKMGYASALATLLFVIVLAMTVVIFKTSRSWVYYEGGPQEGKA
jgi:multiple sugar transport system permease protein